MPYGKCLDHWLAHSSARTILGEYQKFYPIINLVNFWCESQMGVVYIGDISFFEHSQLRSELFTFTVVSGSCAQVDAWVSAQEIIAIVILLGSFTRKSEQNCHCGCWLVSRLGQDAGFYAAKAVSLVMVCNWLDPCQTHLFRRPEELDGTMGMAVF